MKLDGIRKKPPLGDKSHHERRFLENFTSVNYVLIRLLQPIFSEINVSCTPEGTIR
jgi:hypothetical protein